MAWPNISERREDVKKILNNHTPSDLKRIAKKYDCSYTAIWNDIIHLKYGNGTYPSMKLRAIIKERDSYMCQYCGEMPDNCIVDHVIPTWMGGKGVDYNLVAACSSCNIKKKNQVWVPRNFDLIYKLNPEWGEKILSSYVFDFRLKDGEYPEFVTLSVSPDVITAFKKKWGRGWAQKVEDYMASEMDGYNLSPEISK